MDDLSRVVDLIEQANDARPFCPCGRHTTSVWRDGTVWLECASFGESTDGIVARIVAATTSIAHVRLPIVDVPEAGFSLAA